MILSLRAEIHAGFVFLSSIMLLSFLSPYANAAEKVLPGEEKVAIYYLVTHLHPAIYVILFGVFILAVLNLSYQYRFTYLSRPGRSNTASSDITFSTDIQTGTSIIRVPGVSATQLTPLDGINHALPNFCAVRNFVSQPKADNVGNFQFDEKRAHFKLTTKVDLMQVGCILSGNTPLNAGVSSSNIAGIPEVIPDLQMCLDCLGYGGKLGKHGLENTRGGLIMAAKKKQPNTKQAKKP